MTERVGQSLGEGATETERTPSEVNEASGGTCPDYPDKQTPYLVCRFPALAYPFQGLPWKANVTE